MKKLFTEIILILLTLSLTLTSFISCSDKEKQEENTPLYSIEGYSIVRADASGNQTKECTKALKAAIKDTLGLSLTVISDWVKDESEIDKSAKEILVGKTNRAESSAALEKLSGKVEKGAYIIDFSENKVVIVGTNDAATARGIKIFISEYVMKSAKGNSLSLKAGATLTNSFGENKVITASNGVQFEVEISSTVANSPTNVWDTGVGCPSIVELRHSGENNGKLVTTYSVGDSGKRGKPTSLRTAVSSDGGVTWENAGEAVETFDKSIEACWNPHIIELSENLGDLKAGTLILAACSIDAGQKVKSHITLWKSTDCAKTWEQFSLVCEGGGIEEGVWEPYLYYEGGYLYCFYSDDSGADHDQTVAYKRTKDGVNWEKAVDVVAADKYSYRPGMGIVTKMGNGQYFIVYEIFGDWDGCPIYCKVTDDITDWNPSDIGKPLPVSGVTPGSGPWCAWTPAGGECGTLIATSAYGTSDSKIYVSFDYGKSFEAIENPIVRETGSGYGYFPCIYFTEDGKSFYYVDAVNAVEGSASKLGLGRIAFAKVTIY